MRDNLYRFPQVISGAFLINYGLVNTASGHIIRLRGWGIQKTLIVPQVQISFGTIIRNIAFSMLIWIKRAWIDIDIRIEFLNGYIEAARL